MTEKKTVLIVDDELEILELSKEAFEYFNFSVVVASNVSEAVSAIKTYKIDYILTDYLMPEGNGITLVKIIRHQMKLNTPISFLTAESSSAIEDELKNLGVQKIFSKPMDIDEVVIYIQNALKAV
jgi:DNA-binding response OmpR family regulator